MWGGPSATCCLFSARSLERLLVSWRARSLSCKVSALRLVTESEVPTLNLHPNHPNHPAAQQWFKLPVSCQPTISQSGSDRTLFLCQTVSNEPEKKKEQTGILLIPQWENLHHYTTIQCKKRGKKWDTMYLHN